jgi:hypothetical protein
MRHYILGNPGYTWKSCLAIAKEFRKNRVPFYASNKINRRTPVLINWGNSSCKEAKINSTLTVDKFKQLQMLQEAHIPTIEVFKKPYHIPQDKFPVLCRQKVHQAGNDIVIAETPEEVVPAYFYTPFEEFARELRTHAFLVNDELRTRAFKKVLIDDEEEALPIKNLANGYNFRKVSLSEELEEFLRKILETLKMNFMCADIGIRYSPDKIYKVIEVNSAPSLVNNENTLYWYLNNFGESLFEDWKTLGE